MILFHGSPEGGTKILQPHAGKRPLDMSVRPRIFATPDIKTAIVHSRDWVDDDIQFGTVNGVHLIKEARPGGLDVLDGPGHIYAILDSKSFKPLKPEQGYPKGWTTYREYVSEKAVPVVHLLEVPNVLGLLRALRMRIVPYGGSSVGFLGRMIRAASRF